MKDLAVQGNGGKWLGNEHTRQPGRDRDAATRRRRRTNGGTSKKVVAQEKREGEHAETSTTPSRRYHLRLCALATIRCLSSLSLPDSPSSLRADAHHKRGLLSISSLCIPFTHVNRSLISSSFSAFPSLHRLCHRPQTHVTHPDCALSFRNYSAYMPTSFHCHPPFANSLSFLHLSLHMFRTLNPPAQSLCVLTPSRGTITRGSL